MASIEMAPEMERVETQALSWPDRARALVITDGASYTQASELLRGIKGLRAEADGIFDPPIAAGLNAHRAAIAAKKKVVSPLDDAESIIKRSMVAFDDEQERLRRAEQRRQEDIERRRIEDDRIALAAHMETEGKSFGDDALVQEAHDLIAQPIVPIIAPVIKATPVVTGQHFTTTWSARVTSLIDLVKFVAANPSHVGLLAANQPALNAQARSLKEHLKLPGVQPVPTKNVASRAQ